MQQQWNSTPIKIKKLKHQHIPNDRPIKTITASQITHLSQKFPENLNTAFAINRGLTENIDVIIIINFLEQTMTALSNYGNN